MVLILYSSNSRAEDCGSLLECMQMLNTHVEEASERLSALDVRVAQLESNFVDLGGARVLGIVHIENGKLLFGSAGVRWDESNSRIDFENPDGLPFVPLVASSLALSGTAVVNGEHVGITTIHWIADIVQPNSFIVRQHVLDTGVRHSPGTDFVAVIVAFR